jgi:hypothetical protein
MPQDASITKSIEFLSNQHGENLTVVVMINNRKHLRNQA